MATIRNAQRACSLSKPQHTNKITALLTAGLENGKHFTVMYSIVILS